LQSALELSSQLHGRCLAFFDTTANGKHSWRTPKLSSRAAWLSVMSRKTEMAARSACMVNVTPGLLIGSILERGVARRSFGLLRYDLWLQIDPSVTDPSAGYILRHRPLITSFRCVRLLGGPSRLRPR